MHLLALISGQIIREQRGCHLLLLHYANEGVGWGEDSQEYGGGEFNFSYPVIQCSAEKTVGTKWVWHFPTQQALIRSTVDTSLTCLYFQLVGCL